LVARLVLVCLVFRECVDHVLVLSEPLKGAQTLVHRQPVNPDPKIVGA
jgi:hypothetical protein